MGKVAKLHFRYVDTPLGQIHIAECGTGAPVVLLHQTPRSWTEYRYVLPLLGEQFRAIAMDTIGFGSSAKPAGQYSIELFADGVDRLTEALGLETYDLVGHHTGAVIAVEVAARNPTRVRRLVLSASAYREEPYQNLGTHGAIDEVAMRPDGSHLVELWNRRLGFYGAGFEYALHDFLIDGLRVFDRIEDGHTAVHAYGMRTRLAEIRSETLIICGERDTYVMSNVPKLAAALHADSVIIPDAGVPLPEQRPTEFATAVIEFLQR